MTEKGESLDTKGKVGRVNWVCDERHKYLWRASQSSVMPAIKSCGDRPNKRGIYAFIASRNIDRCDLFSPYADEDVGQGNAELNSTSNLKRTGND